VDARDYESPAIGAKDTFTIRRMRAIASGTVYHYFDYFMQVDFASGVTSTATNDAFLQDAYVNIHPMKAIQVQAGKFKEPLSLEILPLDQFLWFLERGVPTELAPNRDVGVEVHGELWNGALSYAAGVFNGVQDGNGNTTSDDVEVSDNDKDAVARFITFPLRNTQIDALKNFGFGLSRGRRRRHSPRWAARHFSRTPTRSLRVASTCAWIRKVVIGGVRCAAIGSTPFRTRSSSTRARRARPTSKTPAGTSTPRGF
jgi:phosphate-selective porin OprO/OprP